MKHRVLIAAPILSIAVLGGVFALVLPGIADDRPQHPAAEILGDAEAERIAAIQSDDDYRSVRAAYVECMRRDYPDFTGAPSAGIELSDGSSWPPSGRITRGQYEFLEDAEHCQEHSGYADLLARHGAASNGPRPEIDQIVFPNDDWSDPRFESPSDLIRHMWECLVERGHEIDPPAQAALALPADHDQATMMRDARECREQWSVVD